MCLLVLAYRTIADAPILVAANREEYFDRPSHPPALHEEPIPLVCPSDAREGGTWLGVNAFRVFVAVTNRFKVKPPAAPRSRGLLCRDLLTRGSAHEAVQHAIEELNQQQYHGANFIIADPQEAWILYAGDEVQFKPISPGLHFLANRNLNEFSNGRLARARSYFEEFPIERAEHFLGEAAEVCKLGPDEMGENPIVLRENSRGTVSSTLLAVTDQPDAAVLLHADGPPDETRYKEFSPLLRDLLRRAKS